MQCRRLLMRSGAVGDDGKPVVDHWYGTTEPLSRVQANEELIFYDPVNFTELGGSRSQNIICFSSRLCSRHLRLQCTLGQINHFLLL